MSPQAPVLDKTVQSELMTSDGWYWRRLLVFSVTAFLCGLILLVTVHPAATILAPSVLAYSFPALMGIVMAYVFGAYWDDKNKRLHAERLGAPLRPSDDEGDPDSPEPPTPAH